MVFRSQHLSLNFSLIITVFVYGRWMEHVFHFQEWLKVSFTSKGKNTSSSDGV